MQVESLITSSGLILEGPLLVKPTIFNDSRGYFYESWNQKIWKQKLVENSEEFKPFVQDNHSSSAFGVLRGLHYQIDPMPQAKLVRCIVGEIFDVAVDLRIKSATFGQWVGVKLSAKNFKQLWIPVGFAHGFLTLSNQAEVLYKTTDFWSKESERSIRWDDPEIAIKWPNLSLNDNSVRPSLSDKDGLSPYLKEVSIGDLFS